MTERERCLTAALEIVMKRGAAYRPPASFFARLARRWGLTLGIEMTARECVLLLLDLKQERAIGGPHDDTVIDIAGYAACLAEVDHVIPREAPPSRAALDAAAHTPHWPRVLAFAEEMDGKLRANLHKGDWRLASEALRRDAAALLDPLIDEVEELRVELVRARVDHRAVTLEAADVANFALMIADLFGGGLAAP